MSDESEPDWHRDDEPSEEEMLLRRWELLAKVREANKRSLTGPDSPDLHPLQECHVRRTIMRKIDVSGDAVRRGDVLEVGGLLHQVRDVRELRGRRKRLEFEDGNAYVLGPGVVITVARAYDGRSGVIHPDGENHVRPTGSTTLQEDFG